MTDDFDADFGVDEWHGTNAFIRDGDRVFRTYFINSRGDEAMGSTWSYLDITALGRQEEWEDSPEGYPQTPPYEWWNWHDEYDDAPTVASRGSRRSSAALPRSAFEWPTDAPCASAGGIDVLVEPEAVLRVVAPLQLDQAVVVRAVRVAGARRLVVGEVVHVHLRRHVRLERGEGLSHPCERWPRSPTGRAIRR